MRLLFKRGKPVNSNGLTMAWSICYSAAAEMKLNKPKKRVQASKRVSTTDCNKVSNHRYSTRRGVSMIQCYITFSRD